MNTSANRFTCWPGGASVLNLLIPYTTQAPVAELDLAQAGFDMFPSVIVIIPAPQSCTAIRLRRKKPHLAFARIAKPPEHHVEVHGASLIY